MFYYIKITYPQLCENQKTNPDIKLPLRSVGSPGVWSPNSATRQVRVLLAAAQEVGMWRTSRDSGRANIHTMLLQWSSRRRPSQVQSMDSGRVGTEVGSDHMQPRDFWKSTQTGVSHFATTTKRIHIWAKFVLDTEPICWNKFGFITIISKFCFCAYLRKKKRALKKYSEFNPPPPQPAETGHSAFFWSARICRQQLKCAPLSAQHA